MSKSVKDLIKEKYGITRPIKEVKGNFDCYNTKTLTSLEGAPIIVSGDFICSSCNLTSLENSPQKVGLDFRCNNNKLTSLEGAPKEIGKHFTCSFNQLTSLEGGPEKVGGYFNCAMNDKQFTEDEVKEVCDVVGSIYV